MKKIFILTIFTLSSLYAYSLNELWNHFNHERYDKVCSKQVWSKDYFNFSSNEEFVNMYAYSCLQIDMINKLAKPITQLRKTKQSRANALYYTTILYQKKLLHHAIVDGVELNLITIPNTKYILSRIYNKFAKKEYKKENNKYIFRENNKTYRLYAKKFNDGFTKLVLESLKDDKIIKTRLYW